MIREITLGQYYQTDSIIHRLDPRIKILGTLIYIISIFIFVNPYVYGWAAIMLIFVIVLSRVPFRHIFKGLKAIIFLILFTAVFNAFLMKGQVVFSFWRFQATKEGIINGIYMTFRLILLMIGSSIMTFTTSPSSLTDGMESILKPLKIFKIPVHEMAMMMSIALRFIPILIEETDKIMKAQLARGADFESGNIIKRVKSLIPIIVPLFVSAFRRASDLAMAMEARCYCGGNGRTKMKPLKYKSRDILGYVFVALYVAGLLYLGININAY